LAIGNANNHKYSLEMQSKRNKRRSTSLADENSIPAKYKHNLSESTCIYLQYAKIVDSKGRMRNLLELDEDWKGGLSEPCRQWKLTGILVLPSDINDLTRGVKFQTLRLFDWTLDFQGFIWALGYGPRNEEYFYLMLSAANEYKPYFNRLLRFKSLALHLYHLCGQNNPPITVQQALERPSPWKGEGGPLLEQEIAQDAKLAAKLLKEALQSDIPLLIDLERLSPESKEASTEEESETNENVAAKSSLEPMPMESPQDNIPYDNVPATEMSAEIPKVVEQKDTCTVQSPTMNRNCQMEGCSCYARDNSKYCSDECGLLRAFLTLKRLQYC